MEMVVGLVSPGYHLVLCQRPTFRQAPRGKEVCESLGRCRRSHTFTRREESSSAPSRVAIAAARKELQAHCSATCANGGDPGGLLEVDHGAKELKHATLQTRPASPMLQDQALESLRGSMPRGRHQSRGRTVPRLVRGRRRSEHADAILLAPIDETSIALSSPRGTRDFRAPVTKKVSSLQWKHGAELEANALPHSGSVVLLRVETHQARADLLRGSDRSPAHSRPRETNPRLRQNFKRAVPRRPQPQLPAP